MRTNLKVVALAVAGMLLCPQIALGAGVRAELDVDANDTNSWYGGAVYDEHGSLPLPDSDTWYNISPRKTYGHNLGDIDDGAGGNLPESTPGGFLGLSGVGQGTSSDRDNWNTPFVAGPPNYFRGNYVNQNTGAQVVYPRAPSPRNGVTWELWFQPASSTSMFVGATPALMSNNVYPSKAGYTFYELPLSGSRLLIWRAGQTDISTPITVANPSDPTEWYHAVGTVDTANNQKLYINGQLVSSTVNPDLNPGGGALTLFRRSSAKTDHTDANISVARIYHRAMDEKEVKQAFNGGAATFGHTPVPTGEAIVSSGLQLHLNAQRTGSWFGGPSRVLDR